MSFFLDKLRCIHCVACNTLESKLMGIIKESDHPKTPDYQLIETGEMLIKPYKTGRK